MLSLHFEYRQRILWARFRGVFSSDDLARLDAAVLPFVAREAPAGAILDFSDVVAVAVPEPILVKRGSWPQIVPRQPRVIVARQGEAFSRARAYASRQREAGNVAPHVVETLQEAYRLFDLEQPTFEAIEG